MNCYPGYGFNNATTPKSCTQNFCTCNNGTPADFCVEHDSEICGSCFAGFVLDEDYLCKTCEVIYGNDFYTYQNGECVLKQCDCLNGHNPNGITTFCTESGADQCRDCHQFYNFNDPSNPRSCTRNVCHCQHGLAKEDCDYHGAHQCQACSDPGHRVSEATNWQCVQNYCTCDNGYPAVGRECTTHQTEICQMCKPFYHLENGLCVENVCTCEGGESVENSKCSTHGHNICQACDKPTHHLVNQSNDEIICDHVPQACSCQNGLPVEDDICSVLGDNQCQSCDPFYHLKGDDCVPNECTCCAGEVVPNDQCVKHGSEQCLSCNDFGYKVDDAGKCVPKVCYCEHGTGVHDGNCMCEDFHRCESCVDGYILDKLTETCQPRPPFCKCDGGLAVTDPNLCKFDGMELCQACFSPAYKVAKKGEIGVLDHHAGHCRPKVCQCENGHGVSNGNCYDESDNNCVACDDGFKLSMDFRADGTYVRSCVPEFESGHVTPVATTTTATAAPVMVDTATTTTTAMPVLVDSTTQRNIRQIDATTQSVEEFETTALLPQETSTAGLDSEPTSPEAETPTLEVTTKIEESTTGMSSKLSEPETTIEIETTIEDIQTTTVSITTEAATKTTGMP